MKRLVLSWLIQSSLLFLLACAPPRATATPEARPPSSGGQTAVATRGAQPVPTSPPDANNPQATPFPTARPHLFDDVEEKQILEGVYAGHTIAPDQDVFDVDSSADWKVWVNDRDEGAITGTGRSELVVIIANLLGSAPPAAATSYGSSSFFLAILDRQGDKLMLTQRLALPIEAPPGESDIRLERTLDVLHDGHDAMLITANTVQGDIVKTAAHLYRYESGKLVELWKGMEQEDNTSATNQNEYYSYQAVVDFQDVDSDGKEEVVVEGERTVYGKNAEGAADLDHPKTTQSERSVYKWNGQAFVLAPSLSTESTPAPAPTP